MGCAKLCSDKVPYNNATLKPSLAPGPETARFFKGQTKTNFPSNLNYDGNVVREMGSMPYGVQHRLAELSHYQQCDGYASSDLFEIPRPSALRHTSRTITIV